MLVLLTNDDGIFAPGLAAMERALRNACEVVVAAPSTEQSGVGHAITFLTPLTAKEVFEGSLRRGWAVDGSPADSVKLAIAEFCPRRPDLVISGINGGLNAGINVLYSGTVAAAIEASFFGITSVAVSLEFDEHADYDRAAFIAMRVIAQILAHAPAAGSLFNLNIPTAALVGTPPLRVVPMSVQRYGEAFERRIDPRGRAYFWATNDPPHPVSSAESDVTALASGAVTLTPLAFDLTQRSMLERLAAASWTFEDASAAGSPAFPTRPPRTPPTRHP
jgi:5'-nucleotidase